MAAGTVTTGGTRPPASKTTNFVEGVGTGGLSLVLMNAATEQGAGPALAALIAMLGAAVLPVVGSFARDWLAARRAALGLGVALIAATVGLSSAPSYAQDAQPPTFGCGAGACSIYVLDVSWPPAIGVNAVEFARFRFGVGLGGVEELGQLSPLGGLCLIPRVDGALGPACQPIGIGG